MPTGDEAGEVRQARVHTVRGELGEHLPQAVDVVEQLRQVVAEGVEGRAVPAGRVRVGLVVLLQELGFAHLPGSSPTDSAHTRARLAARCQWSSNNPHGENSATLDPGAEAGLSAGRCASHSGPG